MASRSPDYIVKALPQGETDWKKSSRIGAAWRNDSGSISLDLDTFVVIQGTGSPKILLIPNEPKKG